MWLQLCLWQTILALLNIDQTFIHKKKKLAQIHWIQMNERIKKGKERKNICSLFINYYFYMKIKFIKLV